MSKSKEWIRMQTKQMGIQCIISAFLAHNRTVRYVLGSLFRLIISAVPQPTISQNERRKQRMTSMSETLRQQKRAKRVAQNREKTTRRRYGLDWMAGERHYHQSLSMIPTLQSQ